MIWFLSGLAVGFVMGISFSLFSIILDSKLRERGLDLSATARAIAKPKASVMLKEDLESREETLNRQYEESI